MAIGDLDDLAVSMLCHTDLYCNQIADVCGLGVGRVRTLNRKLGCRGVHNHSAATVCDMVRFRFYRDKAYRLLLSGRELRAVARECHQNPASLRTWCNANKVPYRCAIEYVTVYALACPITGEVRYVGAAVEPSARYWNHCNHQRNREMLEWIFALATARHKPKLILLAECPKSDSKAIEGYYIRLHAFLGHRLFNHNLLPKCLRT